MRIGIVLPATPGYSETFFRSKIQGLRASGHEVLLFAGQSSPDFQLCPVILAPRVFRNRFLQALLMAFRLCRLLVQAPRPTARYYRLERRNGQSRRQALENLYLNCHILTLRLDWLHFGFATAALRRENVARAIGAKMALSFRGYDVSIYPLKHPGCYDRLWKKADKIHTISDDLLTVARRLGLSEAVPVTKITPAINTAQFQRQSPFPSLPVKGERPLQLLTVARLHWKKGLEYTLEALAILKQQQIPFQYTIAGEGPEYERLVFAAHQLEIRDQVRIAGKVAHEAVKEMMEQADIYLQYSIQEGFCNAVLEAQAMGLLCIVSDAEGLPENVLHGQTGWVAPRRQPVLLARQIEKVLQMPSSTLEGIRHRAMARVQAEFNLQRQQQLFLEFYR